MKTLRCCGIALLLTASLAGGTFQPAAAAEGPAVSKSAPPAPPADRDDHEDSDASADRADSDSDGAQSKDGDDEDEDSAGRGRSHAFSHRHGHDLVNIGRGSHLPAGERADSVVSVFGSSIAEGEASDVVSVMGNTTVTGSVRNTAVAVLGNTIVDGRIDGDVVAVLGNVELGPNAKVAGDVVAVGGQVDRDTAAQVRGTVRTVIGGFKGFGWLQPWIDHCLVYGRPLALAPGLGWAWGLALSLLALYVGLAWLFRDGVTRCVQTLDSHPGTSLVTALVTGLLTPVLLVLLCITVVGIAAVPFVVAALFFTSLFGKAVALAWRGHRAVGARAAERLGHPARAVLVGGAIVLVLYLVPVLGFVVYKLLGLFGLGAVVYTLVLLTRARRAAHAGAQSPAGPQTGAGSQSPEIAPNPAIAPNPEVRPAAAPVISAAGLPRAGFWIRMVALLLDALLVGILMRVLHHLFDAQLLVLAIYGAVMWKLRGSTIGGIVFDLQVVRLDDRPIDWETAIIRALGCFLSLAVAGLGFFWIAFDSGKQAWHDKIAGTVVVRVRKGVPLA